MLKQDSLNILAVIILLVSATVQPAAWAIHVTTVAQQASGELTVRSHVTV